MYKRTRAGFVVLTLFLAGCIWLLTSVPLPLGMDLRGGTELIYELDLSHVTDDPRQVATEVKDIMTRRLNAFGLKELSISIQGDNNLVVQLPGSDDEAVDRIKEQIERAGSLTFRLRATGAEHRRNLERYRQEEREYQQKRDRWAERMREWNQRKESDPDFDLPPPREPQPPEYIVRQWEQTNETTGETYYEPIVLENAPGTYVDGRFIESVAYTMDQNMRPAVAFQMRGEGASKLGDLTGNNVERQLAIVLDDIVVSAPKIQSRISTNGQITGNFTQEEVNDLITVLRGGSLPTKPKRVSENSVGSRLGHEAIERGFQAVFLGLMLVMAFIATYYLAAGLVADFAVVFNIIVVLAYVAAFRQDLTLPGIAGLLLVIGMSVDANILIFERVREERRRGRGLMQALGTGYQRAFSVIFDSNLTTVITGLVLFNFGTGPVKGFAVTLIAGIVVSFISALFVTRLFLSWMLNAGLVKRLRMLQAFQTPKITFSRIQKPFLALSVVVICATWSLVVWRGKGNYGIDFTGGARVRVALSEGVERPEFERLVEQLAEENPEVFRGWAVQTIGTPVRDEAGELPRGEDGQPLYQYREFAVMSRAGSEEGFGRNVAEAQSEEPGGGEDPSGDGGPPDTGEGASPGSGTDPAAGERDAAPAAGDGDEAPSGPAQRVRTALEAALSDRLLPEAFPQEPQWSPAEEGTGESLAVTVHVLEVASSVTVDWIRDSLAERLAGQPRFEEIGVASVEQVGSDPETGVVRYRVELEPFEPAQVRTPEGAPTREEAFAAVRDFFRNPPALEGTEDGTPFKLSDPFPQVSTVGPRVASDLQTKAIVALFISIVGIIFYVSLRFEFIFGLSAIAALVHDVMICVGFMALMDFISRRFLGGAMPIKLNLPELAALLTTIGYSINDTIVVFDRIRENLKATAKKRPPFHEVVDSSINQTLSRTVWTSLTTFLTVAALLFLGGEGVRGFAFVFLVGLMAGTYSSIFVASPILLSLHARSERRRAEVASAAA